MDRGILFNGDMVRAILAGRKTQTRRPVKTEKYPCVDWTYVSVSDGRCYSLRPPFGVPDDRLYVREAFRPMWPVDDPPHTEFRYRASSAEMVGETWTPSIHMPRAAARIWLRVDRVWVERVQDISEEDAQAEGVERWTCFKHSHNHKGDTVEWIGGIPVLPCGYVANPRHADEFHALWRSIYGDDISAWAWACSFTVLSTTGEPDA